MKSDNENRLALINILLYVISKLGDGEFHKVFKILYFAEQEHIKRFGKRLLNDTYIAMKYGPVPSNSYDLLKSVRNGELGAYFLSVSEHRVRAVSEPDLDYLSESEVYCIDNSIEQFGSLSFNERTDKSHDDAYNSVKLNQPMDIFKIAAVGGASEDMVKYLTDHLEAKLLFN